MIARVACRRLTLKSAVAVSVLLAHAASLADTTVLPPARPPGRIHEVEPGENLTRIARRYGVTIPALVTANRLPDDRAIIRIAQRLVIPPPPPRVGVGPTSPPRIPHRRPPVSLVLTVPDFGDRLPMFAWPAEGHVTSTFGRRRGGWHHGVDIKGDMRGPVHAAAGGVVVTSGLEHQYGRVVRVEHINGFLTVYAHNDSNLVRVGDRIQTGQTIALIGRTGRATSHHLHFEIRQRGLAYNPLYFLPLPSRTAVVDRGHREDEGPNE